jgi:hypothetical protein
LSWEELTHFQTKYFPLPGKYRACPDLKIPNPLSFPEGEGLWLNFLIFGGDFLVSFRIIPLRINLPINIEHKNTTFAHD